MPADPDTLERELLHDLSALEEELRDQSFGEELYKALANTKWRKPGSGEGQVSVSWRRAEGIVNELRQNVGQTQALTLAQTGGEGEISARVGDALAATGWRAKGLDTSRVDTRHVTAPPSAPPAEQGEREAPTGDGEGWKSQADAEADAEQQRRR